MVKDHALNIFGLRSDDGPSAQRTALDVTSHNIANANTPGFSRQQAFMSATTPILCLLCSGVRKQPAGNGRDCSRNQTDWGHVHRSTDPQRRPRSGTVGDPAGFAVPSKLIFNEPSDWGIRRPWTCFGGPCKA